jgi:ATP-dependent Clp protease ATP-binding subunit ClpC
MISDTGKSRPLTSRAKRAIDLSDDAAAELGHEAVGTEHLLLGLMGDPIAPAAQILASLGVTKEAIVSAINASRPPRPS